MGTRDEILEQPEATSRLVGAGRATVEAIARSVLEREFNLVVIAARGSSDHAAIYGQYVLGVRNLLPVALAAPSIQTIYGATPRFGRALVIGISQSGASPDIVGVIAAAREQGAPTIAITNVADSALATAAEHVIPLLTGEERSVAATKTYTAQLVALAMLSAGLAHDDTAWSDLTGLPERVSEAVSIEPDVERLAAADARHGIERCVILGRGYEYATAREWALKLKELAYILADPYSSADFQHGPLALIEPGLQVFVVAPGGATSADSAGILERVAAQGARLRVVSDRPELQQLGHDWLALPLEVPEWLTPITSAVVAQLHAYHVSRARGLDPESPRHLRKVTRTT